MTPKCGDISRAFCCNTIESNSGHIIIERHVCCLTFDTEYGIFRISTERKRPKPPLFTFLQSIKTAVVFLIHSVLKSRSLLYRPSIDGFFLIFLLTVLCSYFCTFTGFRPWSTTQTSLKGPRRAAMLFRTCYMSFFSSSFHNLQALCVHAFINFLAMDKGCF